MTATTTRHPGKTKNARKYDGPSPEEKEAIHSTGHSSRLARNMSGGFGTPSYAREELIAEMGSAILCRRLGIGSELHDHASYLNSWIEVLQEEPRALLKALGAAKKAADLIAVEAQAEEVEP